MSKSRGGLGRGLAALIPTGPSTNTVSEVLMGGGPRPAPPSSADPTSAGDPTEPGADATAGSTGGGSSAIAGDGPRYVEIPVAEIRPNPRNPRTVFDQDALDELAHSIREFGLLQPVVVRPAEDGYELVMGERRWRAAQQAGVETVAAIVRRTEDADLLRDALLENIHRTNLNPLEEAAAYQQLLEEFEVTQEELAGRLGRSRPVISNTIRLLNLPVAVQRRVAAGVLSAGHARALLSLSDPGDQEDLAARIVAEGLSVRGAEEAVTLLGRRSPTVRRSQPRKMIMPGVAELATNLSDAFDTRVLVELGRRKGKIVVEFATVDDLERLVAIIAPTVAERRRGSAPGRGAGIRDAQPGTPAVSSANGSPYRTAAEIHAVGNAAAAGAAGNGAASGEANVPENAIADLYEVTAGGFASPSNGRPGPALPDAGAPAETIDSAPSEAATPTGPSPDPSAHTSDGDGRLPATDGRPVLDHWVGPLTNRGSEQAAGPGVGPAAEPTAAAEPAAEPTTGAGPVAEATTTAQPTTAEPAESTIDVGRAADELPDPDHREVQPVGP